MKMTDENKQAYNRTDFFLEQVSYVSHYQGLLHCTACIYRTNNKGIKMQIVLQCGFVKNI